jgi:cobalt-zinc-cadmium efflux system protein
MTHSHHHHDHDHHKERRMAIAAALIGSFMVVEVGGGIVAGSLALIADAGHMLTDFGALALAWVAFRIARWPADGRRTYGFDRFQILVAFANGLALFAIAGWIVVEAARRLVEPAPVAGGLMLVVAAFGLIVNIATFLLLRDADHGNLNVRAAALHVLGDTLGSIAALAAALIIMTTGWTPIDPILSVLVALIILRAAWRVVGEASHILLEGTPGELDPRAIGRDIVASVGGVNDVHHIHLWAITPERTMTTLHAVIDPKADPENVIEAIKRRLDREFGLDHVTVEVETVRCKDKVA